MAENMQLAVYFHTPRWSKFPQYLTKIDSVLIITDRGTEFYAGTSLAEVREKPDAYYIFRKDDKFYVTETKDILRIYYIPEWYDL